MSKRRAAGHRPVENSATDRVEFEKLNDRLLTALADLPDAVATVLGVLVSGGHDQDIEQVLLEYAQQYGPAAEQPALGLTGTGLLVDDLHELAGRIAAAQVLEPADVDWLIRHIEWFRIHPAWIRPQGSKGKLKQCPAHGWFFEPNMPPIGGRRIQACRGCPCPLPTRDTGRPAKFCSSYCRVRAHRAGKRGEDGQPAAQR